MPAVRTCLGAIMIAIIGIFSPLSVAQTSIEIPADIRSHVPKDAFILVYAPSVQKLLDGVAGTASSIDPGVGQMVQMAPMMMSSELFGHESGGPVQIDLEGPAALAVSPGAAGPMGEPAMTIVIGVKSDRDGLKAKMPGGRVTAIPGSSMVAMTSAPETAELGASDRLVKNLPSGEIAISFDQETFVKQYGPMIEMMMTMAGGMGGPGGEQDPEARAMQVQMQRAMKQLKVFMGMFTAWDFAMTFDGSNVATTVRWTLSKPTEKATGSADLGTFADAMVPKAPIGMVMSKSALECMLAMNEEFGDTGMPGATEDAMKKIYDYARTTMGALEGSTGMSVGIDKTGMWSLQLLKVNDLAAYLKDTNDALMALSDSNLGFSVSNLKLVDATGVGYTIRIDPEKMMSAFGMGQMVSPKDMAMLSSVITTAMGGSIGMQVRYLHEGDKMAIICGRNGHVIGRAKQILKAHGTGEPNALTALVSTAQGSPTMAMSMDMRQLVGDVLGFIHSVPALQETHALKFEVPASVPAGDPIRLDATCTAMLDGGQCILNMDIGNFARMMESMDDALRAKKRQQAAMAN